MPKATTFPTPSRRGLLGGAAAAALLGAATPAPTKPASVDLKPDADLIRLSEEYIRAWRAYNAGEPSRPGLSREESDALDEEAFERLLALEARLQSLAAQTIEGVTAEAMVAKCVGSKLGGGFDFDGGHGSEWTERVMWSLLRVQGVAT